MASISEQQSDLYRAHRQRVLDAERTMRNQREEVARLRRTLPQGPAVEDYAFHEAQPEHGRTVRLSELFGDNDELVVYDMMYGPAWEEGCPMCSMWLDGLNGVAHHITRRAAFAVIAKADEDKLRRWAQHRGWGRLRLLSSRGSSFNRDLGFEGEDDDDQFPGVTVFVRDADGTIRLFYTGQADLGADDSRDYEGDPRGIDSISPVWNVLDLLPSGRGDWVPDNTYPLA
jgi:predicted dithiol-disulfide oxidoreductase (DUF899 family)